MLVTNGLRLVKENNKVSRTFRCLSAENIQKVITKGKSNVSPKKIVNKKFHSYPILEKLQKERERESSMYIFKKNSSTTIGLK